MASTPNLEPVAKISAGSAFSFLVAQMCEAVSHDHTFEALEGAHTIAKVRD